MSIRAEDAAVEASRFSLRTSVFGIGDAPPSATATTAASAVVPPPAHLAQHHARPAQHLARPATTATPTTPPRAPATLTFSFQSLGGKPTQAAQAAQAAQLSQASQAQTLQAIARLAEEQRRRASMAPPTSTASASGASLTRTLPSGYINGGTQRVDSHAEIMRLSATIDTLNGKIASQADRLQRTEASLQRANRAMTSERATSNARLLRMQNDMKEFKAREASIRENALAQARREVQKSTTSFGESVKRAEEYDLKMQELKERVKSISSERDTLSGRISTLTTELASAAAKADAAAAAEATAVAEATAAAEAAEAAAVSNKTTEAMQAMEALQRVRDEMATATAEKNDLATRLADAETLRAATQTELEQAFEQRAEAQALVQQSSDEMQALASENERLKAKLDEIVSFPLECETDVVIDPEVFASGVTDALQSLQAEELCAELERIDASLERVFCGLDDTNRVKSYKQIGRLSKHRRDVACALAERTPAPEAAPTEAPTEMHTEAPTDMLIDMDIDTPVDAPVMAVTTAMADATDASASYTPFVPTGCYDPEFENRLMQRMREIDEEDIEDEVESETDEDGEKTTVSVSSVAPASRIVFQRRPVPLCATLARRHPVAASLSARLCQQRSALPSLHEVQRRNRGKPSIETRPLGGVGVNPMAWCRLTRAAFDTQAVHNAEQEAAHAAATPGPPRFTHSMNPTAAPAPTMPPDVAALIEAVSKDISDACVRQRRHYLTVAGVPAEEIESELDGYSVA